MTRLHRRWRVWNWLQEAVLQVLLGVGKGMAYLHMQDIVHGNLTASTVVMTCQPTWPGCRTSSRCSQQGLSTGSSTQSSSRARSSGAGSSGNNTTSCSTGSQGNGLWALTCKFLKHELSGMINDSSHGPRSPAAGAAGHSKGGQNQGGGSESPNPPANSSTGAENDYCCCGSAACHVAAVPALKTAMFGLPR
jgi:hypothetical protein